MRLDFLKRKKWVKLELANQAAHLAEHTAAQQSGEWAPAVQSGEGLTPPATTLKAASALEGLQRSQVASSVPSFAASAKLPGADEIACPGCGAVHAKQDWDRFYKVCPQCGKHGRVSSTQRVAQLLDPGSFTPIAQEVTSTDPLSFPEYPSKLEQAKSQAEAGDAVLVGTGLVEGIPAALFIMEPEFMMGSLGSAAGERITRLVEMAVEKRLPVIGFCASGGARMQEGILSLMQMAKTSAALGRLSAEGLPYIAVLTDPTTGGVTASYAMLGDVILAEPGALIGFAGQRVIEQTIRQSLPEGFQRAEFLLEKGFVDRIVHRAEMRPTLAKLLRLHGFTPAAAATAEAAAADSSTSTVTVTVTAAIETPGGEAHVS